MLLLSEWIEQQGGEAHGHSGVLLGVRIAGERPDTRLVLHYRSHAGGEYDAHWPIWDEECLIVPAVGDDPPHYGSPASCGGIIVSNWADGSIRAKNDPYWAAVERQRRAIAHWRETFPDAAAARPTGIADHREAQAAWRRWAEQFPQARAAWDRIGSVKDYLD